MTTNIIELLHTTAAYQTAAMQLMVGEANFSAGQMQLREAVPAVAVANTNEWSVDPPPMGVGGTVTSSNYTFWFSNGQLRSINKYKWLEKITPPVNQFWELSERPSLLDTNTAYQLATQWLAAISVDVAELERKHPPRIFQAPARKTDSEGRTLPGISSRVLQPLFMIGWGRRPAKRFAS